MMDKELALRTFGYLIGHYKTHEETIINSQEIEAINYILDENERLEQENKKQKEAIDKIQIIITNMQSELIGIKPYHSYVVDGNIIRNMAKNIEDILKEVSE